MTTEPLFITRMSITSQSDLDRVLVCGFRQRKPRQYSDSFKRF